MLESEPRLAVGKLREAQHSKLSLDGLEPLDINGRYLNEMTGRIIKVNSIEVSFNAEHIDKLLEKWRLLQKDLSKLNEDRRRLFESEELIKAEIVDVIKSAGDVPGSTVEKYKPHLSLF